MGKKEEFAELPEEALKPEVEVKKSKKNVLIQAINWLSEHYDFRYNSVLLQVDYKRKKETEWKFFDDIAYRDIDLEMSLDGINISERHFKNLVYGSKLARRYDPLREYIFSLPQWDGENDYIAQFLSQVHLDDETQREFFIDCFKRWLVASVASIVKDEIVNHTCFVLVSKQGRYKTTFLNSLIPAHLKMDFLYASTFIAHNKDHEKYLATKWLINLDEMQAFNRSDIESIKSKITQDKVELRLPYAKADIKAWRRASFCGSVNREEFLNDATGSRRFLPFKIKAIELNKEFNLDLIYIQAFGMFKKGFKFYFDLPDIEKLEAHNEMHKDETMEEEFLLMHYRPVSEEQIRMKSPLVQYLNATEIMDRLCKKHDRINANNTVKKNIGNALAANGFIKVNKRKAGQKGPRYYWAVEEIDSLAASSFEEEEEMPI